MSHYYGRLSGKAKTQATRCGSKGSGIEATVETWQHVVRTSFTHGASGGDLLSVEVTTKEGNRLVSWFGTPEALVSALNANAEHR